ncbi:MAG: putative photosynthetic complex assembly protein PuhE [Tateyamaria sp.]|jgi:putative photosynthetic complex assembly protein 2|uniref:putative photosynthetic complex assembly protein PuhE n=1 Tax=unclassified Tateyamaria TaxID=2645127 RepID=UPI000D561E3E|nr:putative photosynthetic complex assembly protein PuhE [Tateyamaria sp. Alg231-49]
MFTFAWIAAAIAIFSWWFFTGIILLIVRRADGGGATAHGKSVVFGTPLFALGILGLVVSAGTLTIANVYVAFVSVLLVWGWIELAFLSGVITGPEHRPCPDTLQGWPRFIRAWHTLSYHELLLLTGLLIVTVATTGAENTFGFWAYLVLFVARISAKLNLFFGVPRINTEFVPRPLQHIKSYFRQGNVTLAFVIGVTFLSVATACFAKRLMVAETAAQTVGFALLLALSALATIEHWLMVIPLPDAKLWRWMLPARPTTPKTGQSHEL